ncbi:Protein of unknown function [Gryllus bimaculatus]|nr:Protein of unknown function [Gryllus bimaculatus]
MLRGIFVAIADGNESCSPSARRRAAIFSSSAEGASVAKRAGGELPTLRKSRELHRQGSSRAPRRRLPSRLPRRAAGLTRRRSLDASRVAYYGFPQARALSTGAARPFLPSAAGAVLRLGRRASASFSAPPSPPLPPPPFSPPRLQRLLTRHFHALTANALTDAAASANRQRQERRERGHWLAQGRRNGEVVGDEGGGVKRCRQREAVTPESDPD